MLTLDVMGEDVRKEEVGGEEVNDIMDGVDTLEDVALSLVHSLPQHLGKFPRIFTIPIIPVFDLTCCAPVEWCGTAQDGLGDDGSQTAKIRLHDTHQVHQI